MYMEDDKSKLEYLERRARRMEQKARHYEKVAQMAVEALRESEESKEIPFEQIQRMVANDIEMILQQNEREKAMKEHEP